MSEALPLPCGPAQTEQSDEGKSEQSKMRRIAARASNGASRLAARGCGLRGRGAGRSGIDRTAPKGEWLSGCQAEAGAVGARGAIEDTGKIVWPTVIDCSYHAPKRPRVIA